MASVCIRDFICNVVHSSDLPHLRNELFGFSVFVCEQLELLSLCVNGNTHAGSHVTRSVPNRRRTG